MPSSRSASLTASAAWAVEKALVLMSGSASLAASSTSGEERDGEVGQRAEVGEADAAERADARVLAVVEGVDEPLGQQRTDGAGAAGEAVEEAQHRGSDEVLRRGLALGDEVVGEQPALEGRHRVA